MPLIDVGHPAPDFSLKDQHGKSHKLSDYRGRIVVLYFYPEDDTPLCTGQACQFRDHYPEFTKIKAVVLGISPQGVESKRAFADKHALPFTLLADDKPSDSGPPTCVAYGVWDEKNMYGKIVTGMLRTTYIIDTEGKVARRFDRVKTPGHVAAVLGSVKMLHAGELLTFVGKSKKDVKSEAKQGTRTQAGHAGYSGVTGNKNTHNSARSVGSPNKGRNSNARGMR